ncbi:MAG TPA: DUF1801 domain-containing protein [Candidatus Limnocylindria bacterium]|nr:DUF1801 domain-containing protein [Candidatus Limnocylindria bacterium]
MNRSPDVNAWLDRYDNPQKPVVLRVREVILDADPRIEEVVKWSTPTFVYRGNLASFQPRAKQFASLLFHEGASIPGDFTRLSGGGEHARYMQIVDLADAEAVADELRAIVRAWCDARDASAS